MTIDPAEFRRMLSHYPTGVCVVTATTGEGAPVGMSVGSFTAVSLDPLLVGFFPARSSSSWPQIEAAKRFCVNILGAGQEALGLAFARALGFAVGFVLGTAFTAAAFRARFFDTDRAAGPLAAPRIWSISASIARPRSRRRESSTSSFTFC